MTTALHMAAEPLKPLKMTGTTVRVYADRDRMTNAGESGLNCSLNLHVRPSFVPIFLFELRCVFRNIIRGMVEIARAAPGCSREGSPIVQCVVIEMSLWNRLPRNSMVRRWHILFQAIKSVVPIARRQQFWLGGWAPSSAQWPRGQMSGLGK